jgi:hypothetical protein
MAAETREEHDGRLLVVQMTGKLTGGDYARWIPQIERLIAQHGKIRILMEMTDFHGWTAGGVWQDLKFDLKHFGDIERVAIVGQKRWQRGMAKVCSPFTAAQVRYFEHDESPRAHAWVEEGLAVPA